jgi:hypothetical protein
MMRAGRTVADASAVWPQVKALVGAVHLSPLKGELLDKALNGGGPADFELHEDFAPAPEGDALAASKAVDEGNDTSKNGGRAAAAACVHPGLRAKLQAMGGDKIAVVNIESVPAIRNLDAILAVPGLDAVLIGPSDLSANLGIPGEFDHPKFLEAMQTILGKARAAGIGAGVHHACTNGFFAHEKGEKWLEMGCNFFVHSTDIHLFKNKLDEELAAFKKFAGVDQGEVGKVTSGC